MSSSSVIKCATQLTWKLVPLLVVGLLCLPTAIAQDRDAPDRGDAQQPGAQEGPPTGGSGTPFPPPGTQPGVSTNQNGILSMLNGGDPNFPQSPNQTPFVRVVFDDDGLVFPGDDLCTVGIDLERIIEGLLLYDPNAIRFCNPISPTLDPPPLWFGPTDDCGLFARPNFGLSLYDPTAIRICDRFGGLNPLWWGPDDRCGLWPDLDLGMRIYDPTAIRFCNLVDPTLPPPLWWGDLEECGIWPDRELGMRLYDPSAIRICNFANPSLLTPLWWGPDDLCGISPDPTLGMRLYDVRAIRFCDPLGGIPPRLIFGPTDDCTIGIVQDDTGAVLPGLSETDPFGFRLLGQDLQGCRLLFGPTDLCQIKIDPLDPFGFPGMILCDPSGFNMRGRGGLVVSNLGSSGKDGVSIDPGDPANQEPPRIGLPGGILEFGPLCQIKFDPFLGLRFCDPEGFTFDGPEIRTPVVRFGPECTLGVDPRGGLVENDPNGLRLIGTPPGQPSPPLRFGDGNIGIRGNDFQVDSFFDIFYDIDPASGQPLYANIVAREFVQGSSKRWKTNIASIENPLEKIQALRGVTFDWDDAHGGKSSLGLIAEEVAEVVPELVAFEEDGKTAKAVSYSNLVGLLIEGMKTQQEQIDNQQKAVKTLKAENAKLKEQQIERTSQLEDEVQQLRDQVEALVATLSEQKN